MDAIADCNLMTVKTGVCTRSGLYCHPVRSERSTDLLRFRVVGAMSPSKKLLQPESILKKRSAAAPREHGENSISFCCIPPLISAKCR